MKTPLLLIRTISCGLTIAAVVGTLAMAPALASAETGRDLWLRYRTIDVQAQRDSYRTSLSAICAQTDSPTGRIIVSELRRATTGLLGVDLPVNPRTVPSGAIIVGTPATSPLIAGLTWETDLAQAGPEGFVIRAATVAGLPAIVVAANTEIGALYGTFRLVRHLQLRLPLAGLSVSERPRMAIRILNHWDNLDATSERGYAGGPLWIWPDLPDILSPRYEDYARANASIGINGMVPNNVNAKVESLTRPYLLKVAALAKIFRPYGIRLYLSANFAAPKTLGGLSTTDPLDPGVAAWWRAKADEIYGIIPDFGGFLVKANSEGQPGPQDYQRTHADGANMLADAVAPHGGIVMWRAFVYNADVDPDRVKRAYLEFQPLDGRFRENVIVQVKNGPLDFMPREPFSPLFGAMPKTPLLAEVQITQEYLGHSNHLVFLAPMWKEFFDSDTYVKGPGSTVSRVVDGSLHGYRRSGVAGVANTGTDENWTGHHFGQANWYAFGRLAWNPNLSSAEIADEWIRMTWTHDAGTVATMRTLMLGSREHFVDYTMPIGLHHLIGGEHYAVMPENPDPRRADWSAIYYHRADKTAVGFDRTSKGSNAVGQYQPPLRDLWNTPATCPDNLLLWFHRLPWDYRMKSGRFLWDEMVSHYQRGAQAAAAMLSTWDGLRGKIDNERFLAVRAKLEIQKSDAAAWRDHCLQYFQQFSMRPIEGREHD